jgi:predicted nucleic acid-binding protein
MLRILTLPSAMGGNPFTPPEAVQKYQAFAALPEVYFLTDSPNMVATLAIWSTLPFFTPKLWTDAWIAAIAMENGCRVVSFDSDFARFPGLNFLQLTP